MKTISADFVIKDNMGGEYSSTVQVNNPRSSNVMQELKNKVMSIYGLKNIDQIISVTNIMVK